MHIDTGSRKDGPWGDDGSVIYDTEGHLKHFPGSDRGGDQLYKEGVDFGSIWCICRHNGG